MRGVTVTGMAAITPAALDLTRLWESLREPRAPFASGAAPGAFAARVGELLAPADIRRSARFTQLALVAALAAVADADLADPTIDERDRRGVLLGTGFGGANELVAAHGLLVDRGPRHVSPVLSVLAIPEAAASAIATRLGYRGPCEVAGAACATGALTIGRAALLIAAGVCDVIVAGAAEAVVPEVVAVSMERLGVTSRAGLLRPFDRRRDGFVAAEGAGIVVLESIDHAQRRGARRYADIVGVGSCADAASLTSPEAEGTARAMRLALGSLGNEALRHRGAAGRSVEPGEVGYVNAHGSGTPSNDIAEAHAVVDVFGTVDPPWLGATKGATGHQLGAAGAVELVLSALAAWRGEVPPTVGCDEVDAECATALIAQEAQPLARPVVLSNSRGLGGHNVTIALRRVDGA